MEVTRYQEALQTLSRNKAGRDYPNRADARFVDNCILPSFQPGFGLDFTQVRSVFTMGSCFARNIEEVLDPMGVAMPTRSFRVPHEEWPHRSNGLLNEYNPGSISQKILASLRQEPSPEATIYQQGSLFHDLLLCGGTGVSLDRARERRREIAAVYTQLGQAEVVIITLGFVEAWYDEEAKCWLNRMPPHKKDEDPSRFTFRRLDVFDVMPMMLESLDALSATGQKIILTVSPVPMGTTMTRADCVVANEFSKSVLRVCAERLSRKVRNVDYFPSYEIARVAGLPAYRDDNIHVLKSTVEKIIRHMLEGYRSALNVPTRPSDVF